VPRLPIEGIFFGVLDRVTNVIPLTSENWIEGSINIVYRAGLITFLEIS